MPETEAVDLSEHNGEHSAVVITTEGDEPYQYRVYCVGKSRSNPDAVLTAGALNLNGYGFATSGCELGEYQQTVRVKTDEGSRYVDIEIDAAEDEE